MHSKWNTAKGRIITQKGSMKKASLMLLKGKHHKAVRSPATQHHPSLLALFKSAVCNP